jgi:hypothetical protein
MVEKPQFDHKNRRFDAVSSALRLGYDSADNWAGALRRLRVGLDRPAGLALAFGGRHDLIMLEYVADRGTAARGDGGRMGLRP